MRLSDKEEAEIDQETEGQRSETRLAIIMAVCAAAFIAWVEYGPSLVSKEEPAKVAEANVSQLAECDKNCVQLIAGAVNACAGDLSVIESSNITETVFKSSQGDKFSKITYTVEARCTNDVVRTEQWVGYEIAHDD